jgi:hypothetical protein
MQPCWERKGKGCTESEKPQLLPVVHACAHLATLQLGLHWAIRCSSKIAKAVNTCSTLGDTEESYTELCEVNIEGSTTLHSGLPLGLERKLSTGTMTGWTTQSCIELLWVSHVSFNLSHSL